MLKKHQLLLLGIVLVAAVLRLYKLGENPPSLNWDETSLGYNAFAIMTTRHDEHGEYMPIARFVAFGDYKPPGYIYAIVPAMAIFGVNEFAIRFPSAFSGVVMVLLSYFLAKNVTKNRDTGLATAALLAISPWGLQLSRAAFEAHLAALFNILGVLLFVFGTKKPWLLPLSFASFMFSFYTFNANRILAPLLIILLVCIYFREVWQAKKWLVVAVVLAGLMLVPSISYLGSRESKLRFHEVSIFTSLDTVKKANQRMERAGNTWWARIIHNRRIYFAREFLSHYLDHFKGQFLFISGDRNPRLSIQDVGEMYLFEAPLLIIGLLTVLRWKNRASALLFGWLLLAPVPAAVARETPHMLRTASILPTWQVFGGIGFVSLMAWVKDRSSWFQSILYGGFSILVVFSLLYYFHNYWTHYPKDWGGEWQYGYKQMVQKVKNVERDYEKISVTSDLGRPYIYFLLYSKISPFEYLKTRQADRDWYGLWNVYGFEKYDFSGKPRDPNLKTLVVTRAGGIGDSAKVIDTVVAPNGSVVFEMGEQ